MSVIVHCDAPRCPNLSKATQRANLKDRVMVVLPKHWTARADGNGDVELRCAAHSRLPERRHG